MSAQATGRIPAALAQALAPWAPASSSVHEDAREAAAVRADLDYNELKNSGALLRHEIARTHAAEIQAGEHP